MSSSVTAHSGAAAQRAFMAFSTSSARGQPLPLERCLDVLVLWDRRGDSRSLSYHLATNAVNGHTGSAPLLDVLDHALGLGIVGNIKVVVVDVELAVGVSGASGLEGDADVVLADDVEPVALSEGSVLVEDLVDDVLRLSACWSRP